MNDSIQTSIQAHLKALKLNAIPEVLVAELQTALAKATPPEAVIERLLAIEVQARIERRITRRLKEAHLPERKLLADFDFTFQTGVREAQIKSLASLEFIHRRQSVIFGGQSGTGKSHLAKALLLQACSREFRCLYTTAADMLRFLKTGLLDDSLPNKLTRYISPDLLLIDEVGFDRLEQEDARPAALFFKVVDGRYGKKSTILTTNLDLKNLGAYLGDPVITAALLDRLIHHAVLIHIKGPSWRLHESKRLNPIAQPEPDTPPPS